MSGMDAQGQTSAKGASTPRNNPQMGEMTTMDSNGSMTDVLRVQIELNEPKNNMALLEERKIPLITRFNQLLNRPLDELVILSDSIMAAKLPASLSEIHDSIRNNNPMLKMLEQEEAAFFSQEKMIRKMGLPMIGTGLQHDIFKPRANSESMGNGQNMLMPMVSVTIPLWRKKYRASVREAELMGQSVIEQKPDLSNLLMVNYEDSAFEMREITLGASLGEYYIVESGLSEGEKIVTNGVFALDAAAQLNGNYSMMNRPADKTIAVPEKFTDQLTDFVNQYFELKNSLVKSDFQLSQSNAKKLESALSKIEMSLLDDDAHTIWMQHHQVLKQQTGLLVKANDIEKQRVILSPLSNQLIETIDRFRVKPETVFVAYCPMAIEDKGAYWLSEFEEIRNPYFGDAMLTCGEVRKKISMNGKTESKTSQPQGHQH